MSNVRIRSGILSILLAALLAGCSVYSDELLNVDASDASNARPTDGGGDGLRGAVDALGDERRADSDDRDRRDGSGISDIGALDRNIDGTGGAGGASGAAGTSGTAGASGTGGTSGAGGASGAGGTTAGAAGAGGAAGSDAGIADVPTESGTPGSDVADDGTGRDGGCTVPTAPHDEDGDGVDDACDNCPSIPNANQADQGEIGAGLAADGVGDACDPRPNLAGEAIVLFDPLTAGMLGTAWSVYAGTWVAATDTVTETAVGSSQEIDRTDLTNQTNYLAETRFRFDSLPNLDSRMTLPFRMDTSHNGWGCAMTNRAVLALSTIVNGAAGETAPPTTPIAALQVGTRYRVLAGAYGSNIYCLLPETGERITRTSTISPMGTSGLRTHLAAATFEYILVYRLGGALP